MKAHLLWLGNLLRSVIKKEEGQDLIEYALLGSLISVACVASMTSVANALITLFGTVTAAL